MRRDALYDRSLTAFSRKVREELNKPVTSANKELTQSLSA